jgi:glycosyltransferase involved in cell wall biosynthesis
MASVARPGALALKALGGVSQEFPTHIEGQPLAGRKVLIIVENLPLPFDRRVWQEARTLRAAGAEVSIICPTGKGHEARYECLEGIHIHRHRLPIEADSALGYLGEYGLALFWETVLAWKIFFKRGFHVIHGCNPPDLIFLVALQFRLFGVKFLFDHHDINPELYEAKFNRRGFFWKLMVFFEKLTFKVASVSIATNQSYRQIAMERGGKAPADVFVVRSGPDLSRLKAVEPAPRWRNGRRFLVGYVGVMGEQEGIDLLIDAVDYIVHDLGRTDIQFCLVGGGSSLSTLIAEVERRGLADFMTFTGRAPDMDLFEVLSTMDIGVNPDRVNPMNDKSTMNKIMEYMAFGKPMVQFDVTEGRFSAQDASLYARSNDSRDLAAKLVELLDHPECRARMGEFGLQRVENELSWGHQIDPLIAAYQRVFQR